MYVVLHIPTGRLVYREHPQPSNALLLHNALAFYPWQKQDLVVVEVAEAAWDSELAQRQRELPVPLEDQVADLLKRLEDLEKRVL